MASNFSSDPGTPHLNGPGPQGETAPAETLSEGTVRFRSCRWRRPPDEGPECCGHRDVLPLAGTTEFNPDAWCPDCEYFKMRRAPRQRQRQEYW